MNQRNIQPQPPHQEKALQQYIIRSLLSALAQEGHITPEQHRRCLICRPQADRPAP